MGEYDADIARLEAADTELGRQIVDTERYLRAEMDQKVTSARDSFHNDLVAVRDDLKTDIQDVKGGIQWQNRTIGGGVVTGVIFLIVAYAEHLLKFL